MDFAAATCKRRSSRFGSAYTRRAWLTRYLFAQRQGHKIRELTYSFQKDAGCSDLTFPAAHIAGEGSTGERGIFVSNPTPSFSGNLR